MCSKPHADAVDWYEDRCPSGKAQTGAEFWHGWGTIGRLP
jgi:hypothetical protein